MSGNTTYQCGQCDGPLIENPDLADEYPFYCSECDVTYDWEDLAPSTSNQPQSNSCAVEFWRGGDQMSVKDVKEHYQKASDAASAFVEQEARAILRKHSNLREFVMAMGGWFFTLKKADATDEHPVLNDQPRYIAKSKLAHFITEWDEYLKITGEPMRFTADGPVVRNW